MESGLQTYCCIENKKLSTCISFCLRLLLKVKNQTTLLNLNLAFHTQHVGSGLLIVVTAFQPFPTPRGAIPGQTY